MDDKERKEVCPPIFCRELTEMKQKIDNQGYTWPGILMSEIDSEDVIVFSRADKIDKEK